jgi:hypothetical protein
MRRVDTGTVRGQGAHRDGLLGKKSDAMPTSDSAPQESRRSEAPVRKLRILCLHGYHGSADVLRSQMRPLFTDLELLADCVCVDAPSRTAGDFGWWHAVRDEHSPSRDDPGVGSQSRYYKGWDRSRDWLVGEHVDCTHGELARHELPPGPPTGSVCPPPLTRP